MARQKESRLVTFQRTFLSARLGSATLHKYRNQGMHQVLDEARRLNETRRCDPLRVRLAPPDGRAVGRLRKAETPANFG